VPALAVIARLLEDALLAECEPSAISLYHFACFYDVLDEEVFDSLY
jgi:hypothetical protein